MGTDARDDLMEQMITTIYDRVFTELPDKVRKTVTETGEAVGKFNESNTKVHLSVPGIPLYPEDYRNMYSLGNTQGVKSRTAMFSVLVDSIPAAGTNRYVQTPRRVSNAYKAIIKAANSHGPEMSAETKKMLDKVNAFLFCEEKVEEKPSPFADEGEKPKLVTVRGKTQVYKDYENLKEEIDDAVQEMLNVARESSQIADWQADYSNDEITAMSEDEKNRLADRALRRSEDYWETGSFGPRKRYEKLKRQFDGDANMKYVEQALDFQATHGNELSTQLLASCKNLVDLGDFTDPVLTVPIKLSLPSSTNFAKEGSETGYSHISCNTRQRKESKHKVEASLGLGLKGIIKLVTFSVSGGVKTDVEVMDVKSESMSVDFDVCFVNIIRPWLDATLFSEHIRWDAGRDQKEGTVSSGNKDTQEDSKLLPFIPMQMIVAKNVKLKAEWSDEHKKAIEQAAKGGFGIGFGPFRIGPTMTEGSSHLKKDEKSGEEVLEFPGTQCIGFVSWVPPFSAPEAGESQAGEELDKALIEGNDKIEVDAQVVADQASLPPDQREAKYQ